MNVSDICDVPGEAGIVASLILHPEFYFYSEQLTPHDFTVEENGYLYYAISQLVKRGATHIDAFDIVHILNLGEQAGKLSGSALTVAAVKEFIENAGAIARSTVEGYLILVDRVLDASFRRKAYQKLSECQSYCFNMEEQDIEKKIYSTLDSVMLEYATTSEVPQYKDVVDELWAEIQSRQDHAYSGMPFKFPTLNRYATIEPGELFIFAAEAKQGKSMMLLNCAVDLLRQGKSVLYIDSELNSRMFTCRLLAHLTRIEFNRVKSGNYNQEEAKRIAQAIQWMKAQKFTHIYMPIFDQNGIYTTVKKVKHTQGIDVLIVDYFKSSGDADAFASYQELGRITDLVKNEIAGGMNIAAIGAAQATTTGKIADSAKIGRNASTIAIIQDKLPEEIEVDGPACGNKKLRVVLNRNGAQMAPDEYIDLNFNGNLISYEEAKQHIPETPY